MNYPSKSLSFERAKIRCYMEYRYATFFKLLNAALDYFLLNILLVVCLLILSPLSMQTSIVENLGFHLLIANLLWFFASTHSDLYNKVLKTEAVPFLKRVIWALVIFAAAPLILNLIMPGLLISLEYVVPFLLIYSIIILTSKVLFLTIRKSQRRFWVDYKKTVIIGSAESAIELYTYFLDNPNSGHVVEGYFSDKPHKGAMPNFKYLGTPEEAVRYSSRNGVSEIFSTLTYDKKNLVKTLMHEADNNLIRFRFVPDISVFMDKNVLIEYYGSLPVMSPRREPLQVKVNELVKKVFDYVFAAFTTVFILSWLIPIIAIAIKLDSPGPIFFRQLRSGKDNKPFFCLKFRSMYVNKESDSRQATRNDNRITRVGAFLRKTSLDEFPQIINVLRGDMSIVGPRPHMLRHTKDYSQVIDDFMVRQFVTPGITGWAQVNGLRGETKETESMNKRVKADLWYMENWSFLLDLKIVFLTMIQAIKKNENAF